MEYRLRDHTADIAVEAWGETLGDVFAATANGMAATMVEEIPPGGKKHELTVTAENREALLFDYLDELIYERDINQVLPVDNTATVDASGEPDETATKVPDGIDDDPQPAVTWEINASYRGLPLEEIAAREVKAVTYSEMELEETNGGWRAYVVLDM